MRTLWRAGWLGLALVLAAIPAEATPGKAEKFIAAAVALENPHVIYELARLSRTRLKSTIAQIFERDRA